MLYSAVIFVGVIASAIATSTTTVYSPTSTTSDNLVDLMYNYVTDFVNLEVGALYSLQYLFNTDTNKTMFGLPTGPTNTDIFNAFLNMTGRNVFYSFYGQNTARPYYLSPSYQYAYHYTGLGGYYLFNPKTYASNPVNSNILGVSAAATGGTLTSCASTVANWYVNVENGYPYTAEAPYSVGSYNPCQRPWNWPSTIYDGLYFPQPYTSASTGATIVSFGIKFTTPMYDAPAETGVVMTTIYTSMFGTAFAAMNTMGANQVGYVMTTTNPVGLLIASTTTEIANATTYAIHAKNTIISTTAAYIINNNIQSDTEVYVTAAGCLMNVKFWTYGATEDQLLAPPAGLPAGTKPASTQLQWTVVTCTVQTGDTVATVTNDDAATDDDSVKSSVDAIAPVAGAILAFVIIIFLFVFIGCLKFTVFTPSVPLSKQGDVELGSSATKTA